MQEGLVLEAVLPFAQSHFIRESDWFVATELLHSGEIFLKFAKAALPNFKCISIGFFLRAPSSSSQQPAAHKRPCIDHCIMRPLVISETQRGEMLSRWLFLDPLVHLLDSSLINGQAVGYDVRNGVQTHILLTITEGHSLPINSAD